MPRSLEPIPADVAITDTDGTITTFFRLAWQRLIDSVQFTPSVAAVQAANLGAALGATTLYLTRAAGRYRVSLYLRKTTIDGVSSALQATVSWTENGVPLSEQLSSIAADSITTGKQEATLPIVADATTAITLTVTYASNTPGQMKWRYYATVENLA